MSTTVPLKKAVHFEGKSYEKIEVDEPSIGAIEAFEEARASGRSEVAAMIEMLAIDSDWPPGAIRKIRASDMMAIGEALAPFVPKTTPLNGASGGSSSLTSPTS